MRGGGTAVRRTDWLERAAAAALVAAALAAVIAAVRLGSAAGAGEDLLAAVRARTEVRVAGERVQIRPALEAAGRGDRGTALREARAALSGLEGNSQLHLLLAGLYREQGETAPALREYRRAAELLRDYTDRHSPQYVGPGLGLWLREVQPGASAEALSDLHYLERALAGGCS